MRQIIPLALLLAACSTPAAAPQDWRTSAPRDEIKPAFRFEPSGGRDGKGSLVIEHDRREGLQGYWVRSFPVEGGAHYRFQAARRVKDVALAQRSAVVRILWRDEKGKDVLLDEKWDREILKNFPLTAEAEHPVDQETDAVGWTTVGGVYQAPSKAKSAVVEGAW